MCKCIWGRLWGVPRHQPPAGTARGVPPHLTISKYPHEHALHTHTLESSLKVGASCSPRTNTDAHMQPGKLFSLSLVKYRLPLLPLPHIHTHTLTSLIFLSQSQTGAVFPELLICWQHDTKACWEWYTHTNAHKHPQILQTRRETHLKCLNCTFVSSGK